MRKCFGKHINYGSTGIWRAAAVAFLDDVRGRGESHITMRTLFM